MRKHVWHTFTKPCQSDAFALPELIVERIFGTFLIPLRWECMELAVEVFSGRIKHATASCLAVITGIDSDGLSSHCLRRFLPKDVFVLLRIPKSESPSFVLSE